MIRTLLFAAVAACVACTTSESAAEPIAPGSLGTASETPAQMKELTDAVELFQKRDYEGALKLLEEAVKKDPDLPPPHVIMAQFFAQTNVPA
ncbi:MAG: tetratricopeptide repeat protein, partial [Planctomycetes bacterium]|nr:tetratricopeptide repeat protein [Planctomycetota bacterium]